MTRADINVTLPNGKVLHWYWNGDQYITGIRDFYGIDILINNLSEGVEAPQYNGSVTQESAERIVNAWYQFAYARLQEKAKPLHKYAKPLWTDYTDCGYHIDLQKNKFTALAWGKTVFTTVADDEKWLSRAWQFFADEQDNYKQREALEQQLTELGLANTLDNRHDLLRIVEILQNEQYEKTLKIAVSRLTKERNEKAEAAAKKALAEL